MSDTIKSMRLCVTCYLHNTDRTHVDTIAFQWVAGCCKRYTHNYYYFIPNMMQVQIPTETHTAEKATCLRCYSSSHFVFILSFCNIIWLCTIFQHGNIRYTSERERETAKKIVANLFNSHLYKADYDAQHRI